MVRTRVKVGSMRHAIVVQSLSTSVVNGQSTREWSDEDTIFASIEPLTGDEYFEANQMKAGTELRVTIRFYEGLRAPKHRFIHDGRTLNIVRVLDRQERNCVHECWCREEP